MATMPVERDFYVTSPFGPRWGTTHWGVDFGRGGGSGGHAVYAVKDGTVQYAGPASGFGFWVTIDHPASVGGGYSVYGHIIPEVKPGQRVSEGQRIAHINPNSRTNGGVAPHLHLEWHRYVWSQPGPNRLDPMATVLAGARHPGDAPAQAPAPQGNGVIFGVDVSEHQNGLYLSGIRGIDFVIARTTDGTHRDKAYRSHIDDAEHGGLVTSAYHFLRAPSEGASIAQQVQASLQVMGDNHKRPVWLDVETPGGKLTAQDIRTARDLYQQAGVRVAGIYSYVDYWENQITGGEPDTHEFGMVWLASYPSTRQVPYRDLWESINKQKFDYPLGNQKPTIWQYGSTGLVDGWGTGIDVNACRLTKDALRDALYGTSTQQKQEQTPEEVLGNTMERYKSLINPEVALTLPQYIQAVDAATWENRVLISEIARKLGIDPSNVVSSAITADRNQH